MLSLNFLRRATLGLALVLPLLVSAQSWPNKPIKWIIPYPPGGITDNATRMVLQKVQEQTGWSIVVENKPGANSILGAELAARAAPDGYTFLTVIGAHAANATLYAGKLPYDVVKSFAPVSLVGIAPLVMAVNNNLPAKDIRELMAYSKANPGKLAFGSSGVGAAAHLTQELFKQVTSIDMVHVPYKGTAPALTDLMGGNLQILTDTASIVSAPCPQRNRELCIKVCRSDRINRSQNAGATGTGNRRQVATQAQHGAPGKAGKGDRLDLIWGDAACRGAPYAPKRQGISQTLHQEFIQGCAPADK